MLVPTLTNDLHSFKNLPSIAYGHQQFRSGIHRVVMPSKCTKNRSLYICQPLTFVASMLMNHVIHLPCLLSLPCVFCGVKRSKVHSVNLAHVLILLRKKCQPDQSDAVNYLRVISYL